MKIEAGNERAWLKRMEGILGPSFGRLHRLDGERARHWSERRDELFRRGRALGLKSHEGNCSHLYTGDLSPGCGACTEGTWSCLFVNGRCNRRCFYCPQELRSAQKRPPFDGSFFEAFERPEKYVEFLRKMNYRGMSVSGGEPFLTFDTTLTFIREVREAFGREIYIWAYTNGSLYEREKGEQLAEAGLDELRFDISACDYDLEPAGAAARTIPAVSVEIPAIPEDKERLLGLLPRMEEIGVSHLNLHQLYTTKNNCEAFADRGYTVIRDDGPAPAILESEICALEIMCEALERGIGVPINYCSNAYKLRFQSRGVQHRLIELITKDGVTPELGSPTDAGMFRQLVLQGEPDDNRAVADRLRRDGANAGDLTLSDDGDVLYLDAALLDHAAIGRRHVRVNYFRYAAERNTCACSCEGRPIEEDHEVLPRVHRVGPVRHLELKNELARLGFKKLLVEGWPAARTLRHLSTRSYAGAKKRHEIEHFLEQLQEYAKGFEFLNPDFPAYA